MQRFYKVCALACVGATSAGSAYGHAVCGPRIFPVTLTLDDPGVSDEASVPTFTYQRSGADGGPGPVHEYDFEFEFDKRITTNLGIGLNDGWSVFHVENAKTQTGFDNLVATPKYQDCVSPEHEFIVSLGVQREFGGTGTLHTGADKYGSTTPTVYFGKGFGDLPVNALRPVAITGEFSYTIADKALKTMEVVDPDSGTAAEVTNNGNENRWFGGVSIQYSLPYLQSQVKDIGLPSFIGRLTPLVEITWSSPATSPSSLGTTWLAAPGVIYSADSFQVGAEALIPLNKAAGTNVGVIAQLHLFFDDLFPNTLGKPVADWFR